MVNLAQDRTGSTPLAQATAESSLLLLDDDCSARDRMAWSLERQGFRPILVETFEAAMTTIDASAPDFAVIEPRCNAGPCLELVERLRASRPDCRIVIVTAYGSIALAVAAIKAGAIDVLPKPADVDYLTRLLTADGNDDPRRDLGSLQSPARVRWEHINRIYELCGHNVSETARQLSMHRRTLQRILAKRAPA
jgi:two-component system response regulator RegA